MANGAWVTTEEEDAAIAAVGIETPGAFVQRHLQHQLRFVVAQYRAETKTVLAERIEALPPTDKAAVEAILERNRAGAPPGR